MFALHPAINELRSVERNLLMAIRTERDGHVTTVIHHRPDARNAMDPDSADALVHAFLDFEADEDAYVAVLWGEGGAFCAGWDLKFVSSLSPDTLGRELAFPGNSESNPNAIQRGPLGPTRLELSKPVIAAIAGPAVAGGMELALWCDVRIMEEDAYFGVYCRRWGVPLIDGGTVRLPRLVGQGRAMEIILTGRKVAADECLRIGACEEVVSRGESRSAAEAMAHEIARFPQVCVRADRRSAIMQHGKTVREAMKYEWLNGQEPMREEAVQGASRFANGMGRHGNYSKI